MHGHSWLCAERVDQQATCLAARFHAVVVARIGGPGRIIWGRKMAIAVGLNGL